MYAAVPKNVGQWDDPDPEHFFNEAPPGHRFRLYFSAWTTTRLCQKRVEDSAREASAEEKKGRRKNLLRRLDIRRQEWSKAQDFHGLDTEWKKLSLEAIAGCDADATQSSSSGSRTTFDKHAEALQQRQESVFHLLPEVARWRCNCQLSSPLVVGTGVEHPLENGHLFFDPHGLPFLPGSTVKGVLRRAAEELALFGGPEASASWTLPRVWFVFGFDLSSAFFRPGRNDNDRTGTSHAAWHQAYRNHVESLSDADLEPLLGHRPLIAHLYPNDPGRTTADPRFVRDFLLSLSGDIHGDRDPLLNVIRLRGSVAFWDVIFVPPRMRVEIMNPHFSDYYQGDQSPHETGNPNPIYFLAVEQGTRTTFRAHWIAGGDPLPSWSALLDAAHRHACREMGFGAKTATGYGRFRTSSPAASLSARTSGSAGIEAPRTPSIPSGPQKLHTVATVKLDPGSGKLSATLRDGKKAEWTKSMGRPDPLGEERELADRLKKKKELKDVVVEYEEDGNKRTITRIWANTDRGSK